MLNRNKLIAHLASKIGSPLKNGVCFPAQHRFTARNTWQRLNLSIHNPLEVLTINSKFIKQEVGYIITNSHNSFENMRNLNHLLIVASCNLNSFLQCFLRFYCKIVKIHMLYFYLFLMLVVYPLFFKVHVILKRFPII